MRFRDSGPNRRKVITAAAGAIMGLIALTGCGNGEDGTGYALQLPLPSCERGEDMPIKTWGIRTGESIRLAKGDVGKDEINDGAVITPTGGGEFTVDKVNKNDVVGFRPSNEATYFQSGGTIYDVSSQFVENRTAFIISPVCEPKDK